MDDPRSHSPKTKADQVVLDDTDDDDPRHPGRRPSGDGGDIPVLEGRDRGGTGEPVGADNIREGRVRGTMVTPGSAQGQGEGG